MANLATRMLCLLLAGALSVPNVAFSLRAVPLAQTQDASAKVAPPTVRCTGSFQSGVASDSIADAASYLEGAYAEALDSAHKKLPEADQRAIRNAANASGPPDIISCSEDAYGEIPPSSAAALFQHEALRLDRGDVLFDLGAGLGGLAVDAALLGNARRAIGVEISSKRMELGCNVLRRVQGDVQGLTSARTKQTIGKHSNSVELREGDLFGTQDLERATVVYVASLCFREAMMSRLAAMLLHRLRPGTRVISLKSFSEKDSLAPEYGRRLMKVAEPKFPMTWTMPGYAQAVSIYRIEKYGRTAPVG